jgi:hypothetical protein
VSDILKLLPCSSLHPCCLILLISWPTFHPLFWTSMSPRCPCCSCRTADTISSFSEHPCCYTCLYTQQEPSNIDLWCHSLLNPYDFLHLLGRPINYFCYSHSMLFSYLPSYVCSCHRWTAVSWRHRNRDGKQGS